MSAARPADRRGLGSKLSGLVVALGCALFLGGFAWGAVLYKPYTVPTDSMTPTIGVGDRVLAQRIDAGDVRRGDVVVFQDEAWSAMPIVKRVVAVGGDTVACCTDGKLTVNGKTVEESYLAEDGPAALSKIPEVTVPEGRLFLLGDERATSLDSSAHLQDAAKGTVAASAVEARVDAVAWPTDGLLPRPDGFTELPGGISEPGPIRGVLAMIVAGAVLVLAGAAWTPVAGALGKGRRRTDASSRA